MAILIDSKNQTALTSGSPTLEHKVGSSSGNNLLILGIIGRTAANPTHDKVTYNGVDMTKDKDQIFGTNIRVSIWSLVAPSTGSNTIQVYFSANNNCRLISSSYFGVTQSSALDVATSSSGTTASISDSVTTSVSETLTVDALMHEDTSASTPGSSQTTIFATDEGQWNSGASYVVVTSQGDVTMAWTAGGSDSYSHSVASYKAASTTDTGASNDTDPRIFLVS